MIDARGLVCPMPVALVQKEVKANAPKEVEVMVDDQCAVENITRYATNAGYAVSVDKEGTDYRLTLKK